MNILKKWVLFPIAWLFGILASIILLGVLLGVLSEKIGFLWGLFIESILVMFIATSVAKKLKKETAEKLNNNTFITLLCLWGVIGVVTICMWIIGDGSTPKTQPVAETTTVSAVDKAIIQKELDEYMRLAGTVGLVTSYDLSDTGRVVYVGKIWYSQTVESKKRFLNSISSRMTLLTGYHYFVVRDGYSDEKVAEVTAILGSLEIYK